MANSGIKGSQAGTALRRIMTSLNGEVKLSGDAFGEVTIATSNADGSMRDLSDIVTSASVMRLLGRLSRVNSASRIFGYGRV